MVTGQTIYSSEPLIVRVLLYEDMDGNGLTLLWD